MALGSGVMKDNNISISASNSTPGALPEQKIFPGIVHARVRKGSSITGLESTGIGIAKEDDICKQGDEAD